MEFLRLSLLRNVINWWYTNETDYLGAIQSYSNSTVTLSNVTDSFNHQTDKIVEKGEVEVALQWSSTTSLITLPHSL